MKSFYRKVYVILCLSGAITFGLLYLILSGKTETLASMMPSNDSNNSTPSAETKNIDSFATPEIKSETPLPTTTSEIEDTIEYDTTSNDSLYRIVNKTHTINSSYVPNDLVEVSVAKLNNVQLRSEAASALDNLFMAASQDGVQLYAISGYRDQAFQTTLQKYYIEEFGETEAARIDCIPGASEHQLGLAIDLGELSRNCELDGCFAYSSAYTWLKQHAHEYGFVERYPQGKEEITGIKYSPWNFRYVGIEVANKVFESGLCLEEYFNIE